MTAADVLQKLTLLGSPAVVAGMERFGIATTDCFGVRTPVLKQFAREVKNESDDRHGLALALWETGNYEARAVAFMIDDPCKVTIGQMDDWASDFDNWATLDGACGYLFCRTPYAYQKVFEWSERSEEFVKRAAFSLIAYLALHDKKADDDKIASLLSVIESHADDDRNAVRKAVNWALRQIGKRNLYLNRLAIECAERIGKQGTKAARWIASDALRELKSEKIRARMRK